MNIISRAQWGARPWKTSVYRAGVRTHFLVHYHGGIPASDRGISMARNVQKIHLDNGWSGTGYNFMVGQDGVIYEGRGWDLVGAHCPGMNRLGIGVYVAVGGDQKPTPAALKAVRWLYDEACRRNGRALVKSYHSNHYATACPGNPLRSWVNKGMPVDGLPKSSKPAKRPVKVPGRLRVDGLLGPDTYKALQKAVGATADGKWGPATRRALQRHLGVTPDGIIGPATTKALQRAVNARPDGIWGPGTTKALQRALNKGTFKRAGKGTGASALAVDGLLGPATYRALQSRLGVAVDGKFGPATKRALQRHLGVTPDGIIGPATKRALQRKVGVAQDGIWGPATTKALQRALNKGRF